MKWVGRIGKALTLVFAAVVSIPFLIIGWIFTVLLFIGHYTKYLRCDNYR